MTVNLNLSTGRITNCKIDQFGGILLPISENFIVESEDKGYSRIFIDYMPEDYVEEWEGLFV